jgi:sporulation protein YlmC with PRC-barrel domain
MSAQAPEERITGGEDVLDSTGAKVGTVAYAVIKPPEMHLTDIVVSTGALLGRDIVVPTDKIGEMSGGKVHLTIDKNELETLKDYVEVHYDQPPETWAVDAGYMYPSQSVLWPAGSYYPEPTSTTINAPAGTVGIRKGMEVVCSDGHKAGTVQAMDSDPSTGNLTDIIVRHGHLTHHEVRIPCSQVADIEADQVKLAMSKQEFENKLK